ncbi:hypothetical protein ASF03_12025 [Rhizobium sp. Leaf68]|nr:hypothetical protein ASE62_11345 [Rhizobium sp. Leaf202]KQN84016.1 hypothetical protein ASF03_12025 [Rhizobium sp. Leaf68]
MRFVENGPDVPDELLDAREEGKVLFFCGAGVSLAFAGLSDFLNLAADVIEDLGSLSGSSARRLHNAASTKLPSGEKPFVPVDRMFTSLDLEFEPPDVRRSVAKMLKPKSTVDLRGHRALIDLSRGSDGRPRLVTTNFDRLFEACDPEMKSWGPSVLPLPERPTDFEGIVHIHGRVNEDYTDMSEAVVLSSSEFGRAYLSDGWATHYIRRLTDRFKIVFLGYSADDPPVQYLLEALREERSPVENIYAFQFGDELHANEQWHQKGVVPIAFGDDYANLWDTLFAWAERAADPDAWFQHTILKAADGPSTVSPIFRGRIAHMVSTVTGMSKVKAADPPIPSTWLYVFDPQVRYLSPAPVHHHDPNSDELDPFEHFGLDRDEPPPPIDPDDYLARREAPTQAWNAFLPNSRDVIGVSAGDFGSLFGGAAVPRRIWGLIVFILPRMLEAPTLWWAAGQRWMHPELVQQVEDELRYRLRGSDSPLVPYWRYLVARWRRPRVETTQAALEIAHRGTLGWSASLVREAVELSKPRITVERIFGVAPPISVDADPTSFIKLDVDYPDTHQEFAFDPASLQLAVSLWRALLVEAEQLESDIGACISIDTTRPDDGEELTGGYGLTGPVVKFTHLVRALEAADPISAAKEAEVWASHHGLVFERLRIWAAGRPLLMTIEQAQKLFTEIDDATFWSQRHERDLLFAIRDRWDQLPEDGKRAIEIRLLQSPIPDLAEYQSNKAEELTAVHRLNALHWLKEQGVTFSSKVSDEWTRLLETVPSWQEHFADYTAQPQVDKVRFIVTETDPTNILDIPFCDLLPIEVPLTRFRDFKEHDPFAGYAMERPARAILALHSAMRRGVQTAWHYWSTFLRATAKQETTTRMNTVVVQLVGRMSPDEIAKLWYPLVEWFAARARIFEYNGNGQFDQLWDTVVDAAALHPSGYKQKRGRDWSFEAHNSVIGRLVLSLLDMPLPQGSQAVPAAWIERLDRVLSLPGDHARHALHLVAQRSIWFHYHEPQWTKDRVLSKAAGNGPDADAFWSGFSRMGRVPPPELFAQLKSPMFARVGNDGRDERNLIGYLMSGWAGEGSQRVVSDTELRDALVLGGDDVRRTALQFLGDWAEEDERWQSLVMPFVQRVWPKQRTVKKPQMSSELIRFASSVPKQFGEILEAVMGSLVPLSRGHALRLECEVSDLDAAGVDSLVSALQTLLPSERENWPHEGKRLVAAIMTIGVAQGAALDDLSRRAAERDF